MSVVYLHYSHYTDIRCINKRHMYSNINNIISCLVVTKPLNSSGKSTFKIYETNQLQGKHSKKESNIHFQKYSNIQKQNIKVQKIRTESIQAKCFLSPSGLCVSSTLIPTFLLKF